MVHSLRFFANEWEAGWQAHSLAIWVMSGVQLLTQSEPLNDGLVPPGIVGLEVVEQTTPLADQYQQTAARAVIFLVRFEVLRQLTNALAQQRDLNLWTPGVRSVYSVLINDGFLLLSG
jgi:hypothetical protein